MTNANLMREAWEGLQVEVSQHAMASLTAARGATGWAAEIHSMRRSGVIGGNDVFATIGREAELLADPSLEVSEERADRFCALCDYAVEYLNKSRPEQDAMPTA